MGHLTVSQWADDIGISRSTGYRWIREGRGPAVLNVNGTIRIPREAANTWEQRHTIEGGAAQ